MNKTKMDLKGRSASYPKRSFSRAVKIDNTIDVVVESDIHATMKVDSLPPGIINVHQMAEDAARIRDYIVNGNKSEELSGVKFFRPTGLFDS